MKKTTKKKSEVFPKLFIDNSTLIKVEVFAFFDKATGEFYSVVAPELKDKLQMLEQVMNMQSIVFEFTKPNYSEINKYRTSASEWDVDAGKQILNPFKLRDYFLFYHLKSWNLKDNDGKTIELKLGKNGLSDESLSVIYNLNTSILDIILNQYEKLAILV